MPQGGAPTACCGRPAPLPLARLCGWRCRCLGAGAQGRWARTPPLPPPPHRPASPPRRLTSPGPLRAQVRAHAHQRAHLQHAEKEPDPDIPRAGGPPAWPAACVPPACTSKRLASRLSKQACAATTCAPHALMSLTCCCPPHTLY